MMRKTLLITAGTITSSIVTFAIVQAPAPSMTGALPPSQTQVPTQLPPKFVPPPQTGSQTITTPQSPISSLPAPPPQNIANQAFNSFAQQPPQQPNSGVAQPPVFPGSLPPLSSLVGNTPPTTNTVTNPFVVYGFICQKYGTDCKALTSYGLVSKGQRISTHQYIVDVTPYSVVVKDEIKIGKKLHKEYHTYSLFQETTTQP